MPTELVKFVNVKSKYYLNDDILLEYVLDSKFQPSYRDFIGLYPRGWNDLVQYVTFEWIITSEVSPRRNIFFKCRYHSQVVHTDREYQFVYINYKIEVMGRSKYFRFLSTDSMTNPKKSIQKVSSDIALTPNISLQADPISQVIVTPKPSASVTMMFDGHQKPVCLMQPQDQTHIRAFNSEIALPPNDVPAFFNLTSQNTKQTCSFCSHQNDISHEQQKIDSKVKSSAAWIHNLEDRNRALEDRIQDLENELEISLVAQKRLSLGAHHSKRERMAYQKFVHELLNALSQKGIARVIDGQGTEMLVKRVPESASHAENLEERPPQIIGKTSRRERFLKAVIGSQEQKIRDLMVHLDATTKACCNLSMKMDLVSISKDEEGNIGNSGNTQPTKHIPQTLIAVVPKGQGDSIVESPECEKITEESVNRPVDDNKITTDLNFFTPSVSTDVKENVGNDKETIQNNMSEKTELTDFEDNSLNPIAEKATTGSWPKNSTNVKPMEKPSAVVLQCDSTKYALIRY